MHPMCTSCTDNMHTSSGGCTLFMHILRPVCTFGEKKSPASKSRTPFMVFWRFAGSHIRLNSLIVVSGPLFPDCFCTFEPTKEFFETRTVYSRFSN